MTTARIKADYEEARTEIAESGNDAAIELADVIASRAMQARTCLKKKLQRKMIALADAIRHTTEDQT